MVWYTNRSTDRPDSKWLRSLTSLCGLTADFLAFDAYDLSGAAAACAETTIAVTERPTIADARVAALVSENAELQQRLAAAETRAHDMQATLQSVSQSQLMRVRQHGTHASVQRTDFIGRCIDRKSLRGPHSAVSTSGCAPCFKPMFQACTHSSKVRRLEPIDKATV